ICLSLRLAPPNPTLFPYTTLFRSRDATSAATGQNDRAVDYEVEITLDKPPTDIRPDLSATARIVTDTRKHALSIPIIALTVRERSEEHTSELQSRGHLVCRLLLEK